MAFGIVTWEIRTTGSDTNGGGFDATSGTPGTDFSQQDAAQISYTDLVIGTPNTNITSVANPFTSAHVGNIINITGGTGFTVQRIQIMSVSTGVATCDKAVGTIGSTGGTGKLGGCLASPGVVGGLVTTAHFIYIKSGTYLIDLATSNVSGGRINSAGAESTRPVNYIGYGTVRDDFGTKPILFANSGTGQAVLTHAGNHSIIQNIEVDCNNKGTSIGIVNTSINGLVYNCKVSNSTDTGIFATSAIRCYVTSFSGNSGIAVNTKALNCEVYNGSTSGLYCVFDSASVERCLINAATIGIFLGGGNSINQCTVCNCSSHGISVVSTNRNTTIYNSLIYGNGGKGINGNATGVAITNCCMGSNTSGNTDSGARVFGTILLTSNPFINSAGNNLALNFINGGGNLVRLAGYPGTFPGGNTIGYLDGGAAQHREILGNPIIGNWHGGFDE